MSKRATQSEYLPDIEKQKDVKNTAVVVHVPLNGVHVVKANRMLQEWHVEKTVRAPNYSIPEMSKSMIKK